MGRKRTKGDLKSDLVVDGEELVRKGGEVRPESRRTIGCEPGVPPLITIT